MLAESGRVRSLWVAYFNAKLAVADKLCPVDDLLLVT
jgi:hypothetical protein